jgi:hypothetical protein
LPLIELPPHRHDVFAIPLGVTGEQAIATQTAIKASIVSFGTWAGFRAIKR